MCPDSRAIINGIASLSSTILIIFLLIKNGGDGGIRTLDTVARMHP